MLISPQDKRWKEKLLRLVNCGFFDHVPVLRIDAKEGADNKKPNASARPCSLSGEDFRP